MMAKAQALPAAEKAIIDKVRKEIDVASGVGNMFGLEEDMSDGQNISTSAKLEKKEEQSNADAAFKEAMELPEYDNDESNENEEEE